MNINISAQNIEMLVVSKAGLELKFRTLEKFTRRFGSKADLEVMIQKTSQRHETGDVYSAKAVFKIPGKDIFCEGKGQSLDEAADKLKDRLKQLIIGKKEMRQNKWRQAI